MAAQPPTTGPADIPAWRELVREGLDRMGLTQAELARRLNRSDADKTVVTRWLKGTAKPKNAEVAAATARILEIAPATAMRTAGFPEIADLLTPAAVGAEPEDGSAELAAGDLGAALEPLIAVVRGMTDGLEPEERARLLQRFLDRNQDSLLLIETEASRIRQHPEGEGGKSGGGSGRSGSRSAV